MREFTALAFLVIVAIAWAQEEVTVDVTQGTLKGLKKNTNFNGVPYYSFKGVPYAKPLVGSHKFDAPSPPESWTGVLDATKHQQTCVFFCMLKRQMVGDEDCLYLNIYTPDLDKNARKAVMVYFHPGGYTSGSGDDDVFGPDFLVEQDVILVTLNSRLGAHGYLSTADAIVPGNMGLKDQVMALKWVQENIVNFGGCPKRVTIFGISGGGSSVQFLLSSPMSRGLFSGAIIQSGSSLNEWAFEYNPRNIAFKLGEVLGIKTTDSKELVDKLKEYSAQELAAASAEIVKTLNQMNGHTSVFVPVVEPDVGQEIFMPNDPWTMIKSNDVADVPVMIGIMQDETAFMVPLLLDNAPVMDQHFEFFLPTDVNATTAEKKKEYSDMLRQFYLDGKPLTTDSKDALEKLTSDIYFNAGVLMTSKILSARDKSPVYEYLMTYYAPFGLFKNLFKLQEGVSHGDDIGYLFYSNGFQNKPEPGSAAEKMVKLMTKMWANFAKERNPTPKLDEDITVTWTPTGADDNYLNINLPMKMEKSLLKDRMKLWSQIYSNALGDYEKLFN